MSEVSVPGISRADSLFARARAGDQAAWEELFHSCQDKLRRVIRRRLDPPMCAFYDASDILSDVWKSLAAKCDRFDFETFDELMKFLQHSAEQKLIDEFRRQHTLKRDRRREQPLTIHGDEGDAGVLASTDPSPSEVAQAHETHEQLLANLKPDERLAVELRLDKYDTDVIAERTGWHKRKVQRFFKDLCDSWQLWGGSRG